MAVLAGAMMFASAVQAATVDLVDAATGKYTYTPDSFAVPKPASGTDYNAWFFYLVVDGVESLIDLGLIYPPQTTLTFPTLNFTQATPGAPMKVNALLGLRQGGTYWVSPTAQFAEETPNRDGDLTWFTFGEVNVPGISGDEGPWLSARLAPEQAAVVPIAGTLPLLATALGVMGWMVRRRQQSQATA